MEKSIIIAKAEFEEGLATLINNSQLPAFVVRGVLDEIRTTIVQLEQAQYAAEMKEWQESQKKGIEAKEDECR